MQLRTLRYYHGSICMGYQCALHPDPFPQSLRGERLALGIDLAELDTIPLWSNRRSDGRVSIPLVGFVLESFCRCTDELCDQLHLRDLTELEEVHRLRRTLSEELSAILPGEGEGAGPTHLADTYIPADRLRRICGQDGLLGRIVEKCESLLRTASDNEPHEGRR